MSESSRAREAKESIDELEAVRLMLIEEREAWKQRALDNEALRAENAKLLAAIDAALHELGVPNEDYPAPVANAVAILRLSTGKATT